jgi:hypothetical protein
MGASTLRDQYLRDQYLRDGTRTRASPPCEGAAVGKDGSTKSIDICQFLALDLCPIPIGKAL